MGAEAASLNPYPYEPHNQSIPPLPTLHRHPNPLLHQLGLPSLSLLQPQHYQNMAPLILPQKALGNRTSSDLLAIQVPLPSTPTLDSRTGTPPPQLGTPT
ncbi:hypothetical protein LR48_Vigan09g240900 [Vigna angularis]|uniref:Uncharacterized protein n=1 Tax=Phaseolus angularis TaxID=3914 RepID=A0A0L9VFC1_PHAAN|nr:hypothetical protein LR48_Vigan09g240900 [Vigna angularis]